MNVGVPQGSVPGPIWFNIYIDEIFDLTLKDSAIGFADDTSLLCRAGDKDEVQRNYKRDQNILFRWFRGTHVHLNIDKCKKVVYLYRTTS